MTCFDVQHLGSRFTSSLLRCLILATGLALLSAGHLAAQDYFASRVITWIAPGDDGAAGQASEYDIRYATFPIDGSNWHLASQVPDATPVPAPAGSDEFFTVRISNPTPGTTYYIALRTGDEIPNWSPVSDTVSFYFGFGSGIDDSRPTGFELGRSYPNPFNPSTTIEFTVPILTRVTITVYDVLGQRVRDLVDETRAPGDYKTTWDGTDSHGKAVSSGVYLYQI